MKFDEGSFSFKGRCFSTFTFVSFDDKFDGRSFLEVTYTFSDAQLY